MKIKILILLCLFCLAVVFYSVVKIFSEGENYEDYYIEKKDFYYKEESFKFDDLFIVDDIEIPYVGTHIEYIQLGSVDSSNKFEKINKILRKDLDSAKEYFYDRNFSMSEYGIFKNKNILSIRYIGTHYIYNGTTFIYGVNLDLKQEKKLQLTDLITDIDKLYDLLINNKIEFEEDYEEPMRFKKMSSIWSKEEVISSLSNVNELSTNNIYSWYLKDGGKLVICYLGKGFIEYTINLKDIKHIVNREYYKALI